MTIILAVHKPLCKPMIQLYYVLSRTTICSQTFVPNLYAVNVILMWKVLTNLQWRNMKYYMHKIFECVRMTNLMFISRRYTPVVAQPMHVRCQRNAAPVTKRKIIGLKLESLKGKCPRSWKLINKTLIPADQNGNFQVDSRGQSE